MASILENELDEFSIQYWECCQEVFLKQARPELTMTRLSSPLTVPNLCESASKGTHDKTDHLKRKCAEANVKQRGTCEQPLPKRVCLKKCILETVEVLVDEEIPNCCDKDLEDPKRGESKNMYLCEETRQNPPHKGHERVLRQGRSIGNPFYKGRIHTEKPSISMKALKESA